MGILKRSRKALLYFMAILFFFQFLIASYIPVTVNADNSSSGGGSNARVRANIQWAQKKSFQDMDVDDLSQLTYDDLRMIGVFLSNFYEPWSTALGVSDTEDATKEKMVNVLIKQCNFNKDVAEAIVPMIWQMVLDTAQPLSIGVLEDDGTIRKKSRGYEYLAWLQESDGYWDLPGDLTASDDRQALQVNTDGSFVGSYYNFLACWAGTTNIGDDDIRNKVTEAGRNKFCLFWTDGATDRIVFDSGSGADGERTKRFSASSLAYGMLNDNLNYNNGIGSSIFAVEDYDTYKSLSGEQRPLTSIVDSQLYVDCFGDILVDTATNQYIIVPACVNPYAWYVEANGEETAGRRLNLINSYFIAEAESSHIQKWGEKYYFFVYTGDQSLFNLNYFRKWRNNPDYTIDSNAFFNDDETKTMKDLEKQFGHGKLFSENKWFPNWKTYYGWLDESPAASGYEVKSENMYGGLLEGFKDTLPAIPNYSLVQWGAMDDVHVYDDNFQQLVMIDSLGALNSAEDENSSVFKTANLFMDSDTIDEESSQTISGMTGANKFNGIKGNVTTLGSSSTAKQYFVSIYLSYVFAYYDTATGDDRKVPYAFNKNNFPTDMSNIDFSDIEIENNALQEEVMSMAYYIMHPKKGLEYVKTLFKNKIASILCGWHEDMVGAGNGVATTGSTRYIGFSGYVTIPNLGDLTWTSWLLQQYDALVVYFIIVIIVIMLGYVMLGSMTLQRAILGVLIFSICAYLPPKMIDSTVNASNLLCDKIYSSKFTYWALVQHQQYASDINQAVAESDEQRYLSTIFKTQAAQSADNYAVVTLKWQCPKKENYASNVRQELKDMAGNDSIFRLVSGLISSQISGESYDEAAQDLYLYRSYTDVASYAKYSYEEGKYYYRDARISFGMDKGMSFTGASGNGIRPTWSADIAFSGDNNKDAMTIELSKGINRYLTNVIFLNYPFRATETSFDYAVENGFILDSRSTGSSGMEIKISKNYHILSPLCSSSVAISAFSAMGDCPTTLVSSLSQDPLLYTLRSHLTGLPQQCYNNTLYDLNQTSNGSSTGAMKKVGTQSALSATETEAREDAMSLFNFALYTESPFYYFSFNLQDQLEMLKDGVFQEYWSDGSVKLDTKPPENPDYSDLFLAKNGQYFFNNKLTTISGIKAGYGELRDFMDMRSLFTVVIPYLNAVNQQVIDWDETYGLWMYDDIDLKYNDNYELILPSDIDTVNSDEFYRYWHNANVAQLLNLYTPWVDTMYSCKYAEPETIYIAGEKFVVNNPLDPWSYVELGGTSNSTMQIVKGRPMIFSRSEMAYYGLDLNDLTQVELKIIRMYDEVYESLLQLMDYYNFEPEVLCTGASMLETFAFNKNFSETNLFGEDYTLYPQSYELKNFSYDAFLRLILAETTGEDIAASYADSGGSLYMTVINNSSILTGIMFILVDLLACYAIPALKLFFLMAIFAMSVLLILSATIKLEISLPKVLWTSLVSPLLKFFAVTVGMAFAVSLFMSDGNREVTHRGGFTISLGDPVMVLIVMLLINIIVLILYFKIVKKCFSDCMKYGKAVFHNVKGMIGGIATGAVLATAAAVTGGKSGNGVGVGASNNASGVAGMSGASPEQRGKHNVSRRTAMSYGDKHSIRKGMRKELDRSNDKNTSSENNALNPYNKKIDKYTRNRINYEKASEAKKKWGEIANDDKLSDKTRRKAQRKVKKYAKVEGRYEKKYGNQSDKKEKKGSKKKSEKRNRSHSSQTRNKK